MNTVSMPSTLIPEQETEVSGVTMVTDMDMPDHASVSHPPQEETRFSGVHPNQSSTSHEELHDDDPGVCRTLKFSRSGSQNAGQTSVSSKWFEMIDKTENERPFSSDSSTEEKAAELQSNPSISKMNPQFHKTEEAVYHVEVDQVKATTDQKLKIIENIAKDRG